MEFLFSWKTLCRPHFRNFQSKRQKFVNNGNCTQRNKKSNKGNQINIEMDADNQLKYFLYDFNLTE